MQGDLVQPPHPTIARGPAPRASSRSNAARQRDHRRAKGADRKNHIAVIDFETDPFDGTSEILPFCAEIYSDKFGAIVIWDENPDLFVQKVIAAITALPDKYTIYAHNGGKFDFMYMVHKLRGAVKFKGRAIMSAMVGNHELRDSLHLLPEKLAAWKKDTFDYSKMARGKRRKHRDEILAYLHSDCVYLFEIVRAFILEFGFKISIGQAAFSELKKFYKPQNLSENSDEFIRRYFFGGRVECLSGAGLFDSREGEGSFAMYDVNSMYPHCMANFQHPIGNEYNWRRGDIGPDTVFVDVECRNAGALVSRASDGEISSGGQKDLSGGRTRHYTTIWEFNTALRHKLISDIEIIGVVDNAKRSDFSKFIVPLYTRRQLVKARMRDFRQSNPNDYWLIREYEEHKKQDLFLKYLLNNSYGKFAQNPRRFREYYYTDLKSAPPDDWMEFLDELWETDRDAYNEYSMPCLRTGETAVWCKPSPTRKFNNVGTAASITGASRAVLLDAICGADDPIYCDTDSIIARGISGVKIHPSELGAWDLEETYDAVIIGGKKLYAAQIAGLPDHHEKRIKNRCKGSPLIGNAADYATRNAQTWQLYRDIIDGKIIQTVNQTPTFNKIGDQHYMKRTIKMTTERRVK